MITLQDAFKRKYPALDRSRVVDKISRLFEEANGVPLSWDTLTKTNLYNLVCRTKDEVSQNSAKYYMAALSSVLTVYEDDIQLPKDYKKLLHLKRIASVSTWLNESDIDKLVHYSPQSETEEVVKNQFIIGCLTGARHSDFTRFSRANIIDDKLVYVAQKTRLRVEVPVAPLVARLLSYCKPSTISDFHFNRVIRSICCNAGIDDATQVFHGGEAFDGEKWQFVSSHTARRSFATNVYLRCRDIFLVSRYMGHSSVDLTARYILSIGDAPDEVREYFEQFR